ncbi:hypothetical protein PsorP6_000625 [Peronosclerospora sorghi]|uniref:Uncharacterized protein n=1 Tax=Peronosclerospora sorghi TaxID=230839 RepID=A0ACC0WU33_9STRA|nr:hypothetical protein PsorP6_000625 [Peronosclerospora sorghi]
MPSSETSLYDAAHLEPLPPLPAPQAPPAAPPLRPKTHGQNFRTDLSIDDALLTPDAPPNPHAHPLEAVNDPRARTIQQEDTKGGMAIRSSFNLFHHWPLPMGKRLDATFLNRERVQAFTTLRKKDMQESDNPFAVETEHGSRAIAMQFQVQEKEMQKKPPMVPLDEHERILAATEASAKRHELRLQMEKESTWDDGNQERSLGGRDSALARASERKVRKQLDPKWLHSRQDPCNRPKKPLERSEEKELRETLFRTTASDILRSGLLYDKTDIAGYTTTENSSTWPVISTGIVGLPGCCFETYELDPGRT